MFVLNGRGTERRDVGALLCFTEITSGYEAFRSPQSSFSCKAQLKTRWKMSKWPTHVFCEFYQHLCIFTRQTCQSPPITHVHYERRQYTEAAGGKQWSGSKATGVLKEAGNRRKSIPAAGVDCVQAGGKVWPAWGACAGGSTAVRKESGLSFRESSPGWHSYLYWSHKVQQWKISGHSGTAKQAWFTIRWQASLSVFLSLCSSLSFCIWQSSLRYCLGCFPRCLLMMWMVKLYDRWCLDAGLLRAKTRIWAAGLETSAI